MKILKRVYVIINYKTILVTISALAITTLCHYFDYTADFPLSLVSVAIVFPIVFSINSAYQRREKALASFAYLKAHGAAMYLAARDWLAEGTEKDTQNVKLVLQDLLNSIYEMFLSPPEDSLEAEKKVYQCFSDLSLLVKGFRKKGLPSGEISRFNQYISKMLVGFDTMKVIYHYRTPITLRAYSKIFIYSFPVLFAPYFASTFAHYSTGLG